MLIGVPMSDHGLEFEETETTDLKLEESNGPREEVRSAGDERLFAWRANYIGQRRSPFKNLMGTGLWLGVASLAGIFGAFLLSPDSATATDSPLQASLLSGNAASGEERLVEEVVKTPMALAEESLYDPNIVEESVKLWMLGEHAWVQFDYASDVPIFLHWFDAEGRSSLNPIECKDRLGDGLRRCYYGRSYGRINLSLSRGYTPGQWGVFACENYEGTACKKVGDWDIDNPML